MCHEIIVKRQALQFTLARQYPGVWGQHGGRDHFVLRQRVTGPGYHGGVFGQQAFLGQVGVSGACRHR